MKQAPCEHCTALCCRYIALPIDTPGSASDFDDIRWYLMHENVSVFVEDGDWYICFQTRCRYLTSDCRCQVYASRPRICRRYDASNCDYHSGDYNWDHHFTCVEHLEEYLHDRRTRGRSGQEHRSKNGHVRREPASSNGSARRRLRPGRTVRLIPPWETVR